MNPSLTTAPKNEMLALADEIAAVMLDQSHDKWPTVLLRLSETQREFLVSTLRLAATSARDVREALDELLRCANAIVGADPRDQESAEAFTMFDQARVKARRCLALSNLDAASPAAGGDEIPAGYGRVTNDTSRSGDILRYEIDEETRVGKVTDHFSPLQAPADSDAVRNSKFITDKDARYARELLDELDEPTDRLDNREMIVSQWLLHLSAAQGGGAEGGEG